MSKTGISQLARKAQQQQQQPKAHNSNNKPGGNKPNINNSNGAAGATAAAGVENEVPKWKKESSALRDAMRSMRLYQQELSAAKAARPTTASAPAPAVSRPRLTMRK